MSYRICTHRVYRLVIPDEMRAQVHRVLTTQVRMAGVWSGVENRKAAEIQIDAVIRIVSQTDGLLAALMIDNIQVEVFSTYSRDGEILEMLRPLVPYVDFKAGKNGD